MADVTDATSNELTQKETTSDTYVPVYRKDQQQRTKTASPWMHWPVSGSYKGPSCRKQTSWGEAPPR